MGRSKVKQFGANEFFPAAQNKEHPTKKPFMAIWFRLCHTAQQPLSIGHIAVPEKPTSSRIKNR